MHRDDDETFCSNSKAIFLGLLHEFTFKEKKLHVNRKSPNKFLSSTCSTLFFMEGGRVKAYLIRPALHGRTTMLQ